MAKLNAYGQREVFRFARERTYTLEQNPDIEWDRIERAIMHNGRVLEKRTVIFRAKGIFKAYRHTWGWKLYAHLKPGHTPQSCRDLLLAPLKSGRPNPWKQTKGETA